MNLIFSNYTPKINFYPTNDKRGNFGWSVSCLLHPSFDFLLNKDSTIPSYILEDERCFLSFLAGFFDSEGSIIICRTEPRLVGYRLRMPNTNFGVLIKMKGKLSELGFSPKLYLAYKSGRCWKVEINRKSDVFKLLSMLPLRHSEKIMRRDLAFHLRDVKSWDEAKPKVSALRTIIENEVKRCKHEAEMVYRAKLYEKVKP